MLTTHCLLCQKHIAAGERRFSYASGWICFTCGQETRGNPSYGGADYALGQGASAQKLINPRKRRRLMLAIASSLAAIVIVPSATIWVAYWLVLPAPQAALIDQPPPFAPVSPAEVNPVESVRPATNTSPLTPVTKTMEPEKGISPAPVPAQDIALEPEPATPISPPAIGEDDKAIAAALAPSIPPSFKPVVPPASVQPASPLPPGQSSAEPSTSNTKPPAKPTPEQDPLDQAIAQGSRSLVLGDLKSANSLFLQATRIASKDERALAGRALTRYFAGSTQEAIDQLEDMHSRQPSRLVSFNLASMHYSRNVLRSARVLHDYMRETNVLDETAFDSFTLALWQSQWSARKSVMFWEMVRYHQLYEQRLRLARGTNEQKWGMTWVKPEDMIENLAKLREAREQERDTRQDVRELVRQRQQVIPRLISNEGSSSGVDMSSLNREIAQARLRLRQARTAIGAAGPPLPADIPLLVP